MKYLENLALAQSLAGCKSLEVVNCEKGEDRQGPPAPFMTSTLLQAGSQLRQSADQVRASSQKLYDKGHITYIRSDSPVMALEALEALRQYCESQGWPCAPKARTWKAKDAAQAAHECIRPTVIAMEEAGDGPEEKALYRLIRLRTLATQLEDAVSDLVTLTLKGEYEGRPVMFEAKGRVLRSPGWLVLYGKEAQAEDGPENPVPILEVGAAVTALSGEVITIKTAPPAFYSEGSLIRELERRNIGRPSTYASIVETLKKRGYASLEKSALVPTPLGERLIATVLNNFAFADYQYTANMEQALDEIASGKQSYKAVLAPAYEIILKEVREFEKAHGKVCPKCGRQMAKRTGRKGSFYGCSGFPDCSETLPDD